MPRACADKDDVDDDDDDDGGGGGGDTGFVYLNKTEVNEGVTVEQLRTVIRTYVSEVYDTSGQDLYDVLQYQYRHVQDDWTSSRADIDRASVRHVLMQLLADGHQVVNLQMFHTLPDLNVFFSSGLLSYLPSPFLRITRCLLLQRRRQWGGGARGACPPPE